MRSLSLKFLLSLTDPVREITTPAPNYYLRRRLGLHRHLRRLWKRGENSGQRKKNFLQLWVNWAGVKWIMTSYSISPLTNIQEEQYRHKDNETSTLHNSPTVSVTIHKTPFKLVHWPMLADQHWPPIFMKQEIQEKMCNIIRHYKIQIKSTMKYHFV